MLLIIEIVAFVALAVRECIKAEAAHQVLSKLSLVSPPVYPLLHSLNCYQQIYNSVYHISAPLSFIGRPIRPSI